jgi:hypothetical protein
VLVQVQGPQPSGKAAYIGLKVRWTLRTCIQDSWAMAWPPLLRLTWPGETLGQSPAFARFGHRRAGHTAYGHPSEGPIGPLALAICRLVPCGPAAGR